MARSALAGFLGLALGLSPFVGGLYDFDRWGPVALLVALVSVVLVAGSTDLPRGWSRVPLAALVALAIFQFASARWAEDTEEVLLSGHRTLLYVCMLALFIVLFRERRAPVMLLGGFVAGTAAVASHDLFLLLDGSSEALFRGRLDAPLGYVNGQAAAFALGCWPLFAAAERTARIVIAGPAAGLAALFCSLVVLTQSRGALIALIVGALAVLIVIPGRTRRLALMVVIVAAVAFAWPDLGALSAGFDFNSNQADPEAQRAAALAALATALGAGIVWALVRVAESRLARRVTRVPTRPVKRAAWIAGLLAVLAVGAVAAPSVVDTADQRWDRFKALEPADARSRLTSPGGNRYDYWRVALSQFRRWPWGGTGAGNYDRTYFLERRTAEDVRQPHSLELQTLAETGVLGTVILAAFLIAGFGALVVRARQAANAEDRIGITAACAGLWLTWLVHTSVDWIHLLPGVTGAAIAALAFLCGRWDRQAAAKPWLVVRPLVFAGLTIAMASLGILLTADTYRQQAIARLPEDPSRAADEARSALKLVGDAPDTYFVLAAAQARSDRYDDARATLREAIRRKPHDFIPHALLGDLALRRGDRRRANEDYRRALALNPRSVTLRNSVARTTTARP